MMDDSKPQQLWDDWCEAPDVPGAVSAVLLFAETANGIYYAVKTDRGMHGVHVDQETMEFERQNALVRYRLDGQKAEAKRIRDNAAERIIRAAHLLAQVACFAAGSSALLFLAHTGAVAGWIAHLGTTVWGVVLGWQIKKSN